MKKRERPGCHYCEGTGWNPEAFRVDVDDFRGADCEFCDGSGIATRSANTDTTYRHEDPLFALKRARKYGRRHVSAYKAGAARDDGFDPYLNVKRRAIGRRCLHVLVNAEIAIRARKTATHSNLHPVFEHLFAPFLRAA